MSEFPMIERLGLEVRYTEEFGDAVNATHLEALLQSAPVVSGAPEGNLWSKDSEDYDTQTALLVGIQPVVKDSVESLLREFVASLDSIQERNDLRDIVERAKRLIGDK